MKTALVTGGKGFVGRHLVPALEDAGYDVFICDIANGGTDCRDLFRDTMSNPFDLVVHLAAIVGGRATIEHEPMRVATDLAIDADLFQWALRTEQRKVVYYSSSAAYPIWYQSANDAQRLAEDDINLTDIEQPDLTYGLAKLVGEVQAMHARAQGLDVVVFRPFSGYGTDQDLDYPFPSFIERARLRADPFRIWGDGRQTRDFIHIDDIVAATLTAVDQGVTGPVNLCTGRATSFNMLAALVCHEAGYIPKLDYNLASPVGVRGRVGDPKRMNEFYTAKITLEEGIKRAL